METVAQDVATALDKLADVAAELLESAGAEASSSASSATCTLDLSRVVLVGHSAGGHLALWLSQAHREAAVPGGLLPPLPPASSSSSGGGTVGGGAPAPRVRIVPIAVVGQVRRRRRVTAHPDISHSIHIILDRTIDARCLCVLAHAISRTHARTPA